jgi:hypothetical protein
VIDPNVCKCAPDDVEQGIHYNECNGALSKHPRKLVYIAAPFSPTAAQKLSCPMHEYPACVEANKAAAAALGLHVAALGAMPVVPHTAHGGRPELEHVQGYRFWIEGTDELLQGCDAALFSKNWQESPGACSEHATCVALGLPIFYEPEALAVWLRDPDNTHTSLLKDRLDRLTRRIALHHDTERPPAIDPPGRSD